MQYQSGPVTHTDEYAPHTIPTISGSANSRILVTPRTYKTATITNVVRDVLIDFSGALVGVFIALMLVFITRKIKNWKRGLSREKKTVN